MKKKPHDPTTPAEWQEAVDLAKFYLLVDSCEQYGLIEGPRVNTDRCEELLEGGRERGIRPAAEQTLVDRFVPLLLRPQNDDHHEQREHRHLRVKERSH